MADPLVTVIIPTFERVDFLSRAIESVLGQTFDDLEVVVVDDGPSDAIAEFVTGHADPRVRLVRHAVNRGVAAARNSGIAAATGSYIGLLDDDDIWLPTKLERQLELLEGEAADVVHTLVYVADGEGNVFDGPSEAGFRLFREVAAAGYPYEWLLRRSSFFINTFVVRRECIDEIGGFDEDLAAVDDLDFVHRLSRRYELRLVDEPLVKYCFHGRNLSNDKDPATWFRLAAKELRWLEQAHPPNQRKIEAYLYRQIAQGAWIGGSYRKAVAAAVRSRRLDRSTISTSTVVKYLVAACTVPALVDAARRSSRRRRPVAEPYPWIDL